MRRSVRLSILLIGLTLPALAAAQPAGRPMTIHDLIVSVRITDPQLSPDGRTVLFTRTTTDGPTGRRNADIWQVPADGSGQAAPLIVGDRAETAPRFSPDGRRVAFISTRDGSSQAYVANADGTGVRKVTDLAMGIKPPLVFSPDGSRLAFVSDVYAGCRDEACNRRLRDEAEKNPVKMRRLRRLLYRHWDQWRTDIRQHVFVADVETGEAHDLTPGDFDSPPFFQEDYSIAFSPDGREVAFVSNREGIDREAWTTNTDVWIVPVAGGTPRNLTADNPAGNAQPIFSPDGRSVLVRGQRRAGFESDRWYIDVYDRASGTRRTVFETPDLSVESIALSADGRTIWFLAQQEARVNLFVVPAAGGTPKRVLQGGSIGSFKLGENFVVYVASTLNAPPEVFRAAADGSGVRPLTEANRTWLTQVAMSEPESRSVPGAEGRPVQYWLVRPPGFDPGRRYPVVFLVHGGPQSAWLDGWSFRWNPTLWAAQGWVLVLPNPHGSTGFGQPYVDAISRDWAGRIMTDLDIVFDTVAKMPFADPARMGIAGASYGGYAVNWIIGQTDRFKAAVSHQGVFNLENMSMSTEELWFTEWEFGGRPWEPTAREQFAKFSPHHHGHRIRTPTLIVANELDFRVPIDQGLQLFTVLRRNGVPAEALVFPDEGHWVLGALNSRAWHEAVFDWMRRYLK